MYYIVDSNFKIIFGWSAKCACSHLKRVYWNLKTNNLNPKIHTSIERNKLPIDIENYTTIVVTRNPYERLVSGFLDKYHTKGEFRQKWKHDKITFSMFIEELEKKSEMIEQHHFEPQTSGDFDEKMFNSKRFLSFDIKNIDYNIIEHLFNNTIHESIKQPFNSRKKYGKSYNDYVFDLDMNVYEYYDVEIEYFYNDDLKKRVYNYYEKDFGFISRLGVIF